MIIPDFMNITVRALIYGYEIVQVRNVRIFLVVNAAMVTIPVFF